VARRAARALNLRGLVRGERAEARPPALAAAASITVRLADRGDQAAIERLAELSDRLAPSGRYLVADVDGQLWAALPLSGGETLADPFLPAQEVKALLSLRAAQLDARKGAWDRETPKLAPVLSPEGRAC
jgi:hypothetical protein